MQAITTKNIPMTTTKPNRIKISCQRKTLTISQYDNRLDQSLSSNSDELHRQAAMILLNSFALEDAKKYSIPELSHEHHWLRNGGILNTGVIKTGEHVHVIS